MELHLFVLWKRENIFLVRQILAQQRGTVMAFIPNHKKLLKFPFEIKCMTKSPKLMLRHTYMHEMSVYFCNNIHLSKLINEHFTHSFFLTKAPIILNIF